MDEARLERDVREEMQAGKVPGLALAIFDDRGVRYAKGFGVMSLDEGGLPVTPHTLFRIGSTTKPLTGTAVMRLVERGLLDLDHPIAASPSRPKSTPMAATTSSSRPARGWPSGSTGCSRRPGSGSPSSTSTSTSAA